MACRQPLSDSKIIEAKAAAKAAAKKSGALERSRSAKERGALERKQSQVTHTSTHRPLLVYNQSHHSPAATPVTGGI